MAVIKQKTVGGMTYKLRQAKTEKEGKQYEYYVTEDGSPIDDPVYTRRRAMQQFRETINAVQRAEGEDRAASRGPSIPGFGQSTGERSMSPLGLGMEDDDDDKDSGLPFW